MRLTIHRHRKWQTSDGRIWLMPLADGGWVAMIPQDGDRARAIAAGMYRQVQSSISLGLGLHATARAVAEVIESEARLVWRKGSGYYVLEDDRPNGFLVHRGADGWMLRGSSMFSTSGLDEGRVAALRTFSGPYPTKVSALAALEGIIADATR